MLGTPTAAGLLPAARCVQSRATVDCALHCFVLTTGGATEAFQDGTTKLQ